MLTNFTIAYAVPGEPGSDGNDVNHGKYDGTINALP
jgi:hypothetical protein